MRGFTFYLAVFGRCFGRTLRAGTSSTTFFLIKNDRIPAINKKINAIVKNKPFSTKPYSAHTISNAPLVLLNFHAKKPKKIDKNDTQNTAAPLSAMSFSLNPTPNAVTRKPLASPLKPPKIAKTATQIFIISLLLDLYFPCDFFSVPTKHWGIH